MEPLCSKWPGLRVALTRGLERSVISYEVLAECILGYAALNRAGTSEVTELEGLLTVQSGFHRRVDVQLRDENAACQAAADEGVRGRRRFASSLAWRPRS